MTRYRGPSKNLLQQNLFLIKIYRISSTVWMLRKLYNSGRSKQIIRKQLCLWNKTRERGTEAKTRTFPALRKDSQQTNEETYRAKTFTILKGDKGGDPFTFQKTQNEKDFTDTLQLLIPSKRRSTNIRRHTTGESNTKKQRVFFFI